MGLFSKLKKAQAQASGGMGSAMARPAAPRPTLIQGGPAFFTPEGYTPPIQPEQAFMPTDVMRDPIADMFAAQPPLTRGPSLPKPPIPPREDQIFIDDMPPMREEPPMDFPMPQPPVEMPIVEDDPIMRSLPVGDPVPFVPPPIPSRGIIGSNPIIESGTGGIGARPDLPQLPRSSLFGGKGMRDDFMSIGGPGGGYTTGTSELMDRMFPDGPQPIPQDLPIMPPIMPPMREVPPEDFGFGPGIRRSEDFFRGEDLIMPPMAPPKPLGEDVPPMPIENMIMANDPSIMPMPPKMPMLPEPMPMPMPMPSPMPIRPRMPMPGPIATPMPMAPTNLQLPELETKMPMMSLDRGMGSFKTLV